MLLAATGAGTLAVARTHIGTPVYMPPEVIMNQPYGTACDVRALAGDLHHEGFKHTILVK